MNREPAHFARVYEEHVWQIYAFFVYRIGDRVAAEDLTQATFERGLRAWARFDRQRGSERTWLLAIAHNLLIDDHRRRSRSSEALIQGKLDALMQPDEPFETPLELDEALAQLSLREREVLALRYGGDLSGPDIAALLGLTLANVQQITSRSLRKLRALLEAPQTAPPASSVPSAMRATPSSK